MRGEQTLNIASFHKSGPKAARAVDQTLIDAQEEEVVAADFPMAKESAFIPQCGRWGTGAIRKGELERRLDSRTAWYERNTPHFLESWILYEIYSKCGNEVSLEKSVGTQLDKDLRIHFYKPAMLLAAIEFVIVEKILTSEGIEPGKRK